MHHKCEGKYLVLVSFGGGVVASAASIGGASLRRRPDPLPSRSVSVALRQRLTPSASHTSPSSPRYLPGYRGTSMYIQRTR